jgi:hypothetical protein
LRHSNFAANRKVRVSTRVSKMPIWAPLESEQEVFAPDTLAALAIALEDTLRHLRLADRNDPAVTRVAKRIIELARKGECDPVRLRDRTLQSFHQSMKDPLDAPPTRK